MIICITLIISHTGGWRFFTNSFLAHDLNRAAFWSKTELQPQKVVVVAIDDEGYQGFFSAKSPLDRTQVTQLLKTVLISAPNVKRIALDLDLSPVPTQAAGQQVLDTYILQDPKRWVLPAVNSGSKVDMAAQKIWRNGLCSQGVSFGLPYVPNEFGYPKLIHQYKHGLAETSLLPPGQCADLSEESKQIVMPLSPTTLNGGLVVPFSGDLKALSEILRAVEPDWIVIGGAWGNTDVFATPFGDRFGVQIHAAALSGALEQQRVAPFWLQLLSAWIFVAVLGVLLNSTNQAFARWFKPLSEQMSGHQFSIQILHPIFFILTTFALLYVVSESLSFVHAHTGYWLPSGYVASVGVGTVLFTWNLGRITTVQYENYQVAWQKVVSVPIKQDIHSLTTSMKVLFSGPHKIHWDICGSMVPVSRGRALVEALLCIGSLMTQVILPFALSLLFAMKDI